MQETTIVYLKRPTIIVVIISIGAYCQLNLLRKDLSTNQEDPFQAKSYYFSDFYAIKSAFT